MHSVSLAETLYDFIHIYESYILCKCYADQIIRYTPLYTYL